MAAEETGRPAALTCAGAEDRREDRQTCRQSGWQTPRLIVEPRPKSETTRDESFDGESVRRSDTRPDRQAGLGRQGGRYVAGRRPEDTGVRRG